VTLYVLLQVLCISAFADSKSKDTRAEFLSTAREFSAACETAFLHNPSGTQMPPDAAKTLCTCASTESKHQGITLKALRLETEELKKDPKHTFHDQHLLDAIHYCMYLEMNKSE